MTSKYIWPLLLGLAAATIAPATQAQVSNDALQQRIEAMERQLQALKNSLNETRKQAKQASRKAAAASKEARAGDAALSKFRLTGYTATGFKLTDAGDVGTTFTGAKFNPIFLYQYNNSLLFEGELELEVEDDGGTDVGLEFATVSYVLNDAMTVAGGKFLSPLGLFQERLHPNWINKLPDRPAGYNPKGGGLPGSEIGLMLRGGLSLDPVLVNYSVFVGNGPQVRLTAGSLDFLDFRAFGDDDNDNKAFGGRIGVLPVTGVELGASVLSSKIKGKKVSGIAGALSEGDFLWWGVDASYTKGAADLRFEYFSSELDSFRSQSTAGTATTLIPKTEWQGWYVQGAYQLSKLTSVPFLRNLEPVIRYGEFDVDGFSGFVAGGAPEDRFTLGLNYLIAPSAILKAAVSWRNFREDSVEDATEFRAQVTYGF
jgi:hypothetical protein